MASKRRSCDDTPQCYARKPSPSVVRFEHSACEHVHRGVGLRELADRAPLREHRAGLFELKEDALQHILRLAPGPQTLPAAVRGEVVSEAPAARPHAAATVATGAPAAAPSGAVLESGKKEKKEKKVRRQCGRPGAFRASVPRACPCPNHYLI